jgi:hypothetical protein
MRRGSPRGAGFRVSRFDADIHDRNFTRTDSSNGFLQGREKVA